MIWQHWAGHGYVTTNQLFKNKNMAPSRFHRETHDFRPHGLALKSHGFKVADSVACLETMTEPARLLLQRFSKFLHVLQCEEQRTPLLT